MSAGFYFSAGQLLRVSSETASAVEIPEEFTTESSSISLHSVAAKMSASTRVTVSCNCKPPKCSGRCRRAKNNVKCSVHCHSSKFDCGNLSSLLHRTEIALVPVATMESGRGDHASSSGTGRKRAATSTITKALCAPKRMRN